MSTTTAYKIGKGQCEQIGEFKNAWRGGAYVWNQIAKDYFSLEYFPMFDSLMQKKVWNAGDYKPISDCEYIALASTMDKATVRATIENMNILMNAFEEYGKAHPNSSYTEQYLVLEAVSTKLSESDFIAWQQTSCGEFWVEGEYCEEIEEYKYYNPNDSEEHFDVIEEFKKWKNQPTNQETKNEPKNRNIS